jgi:hypothetical protein
LFSIGTITLLEEIISLLNVGISEIRSIEESNSKRRTSDQTTIKMVPSIVKLEDFCVKPEGFIGRQGLSKNLLPS